MDVSRSNEHYDASSGSGLICKVCFALVPRMAEYAELHVGWHHDEGHIAESGSQGGR